VTSTKPEVGVAWTRRLGAFLAIGTSPGALVLGAGLTLRNEGAVPVLGLAVGAIAMAAMLYGQGLLGVVPPVGSGGSLADAADGYLGRRTLPLLHGLLAFAMVGWFGFNVGLGGAALAVVLRVPGPIGAVLLAVPIVLVAARGRRGWNGLAIVTTVAALALVGLVVSRTASGPLPVVVAGPSAFGWLADAGALIGYVAVFSLRAPDFSQGLAARRDLAICVGALVGSTLLVALAGAALARATGTIDVVAAVSGVSAPLVGNLLVATAVVAATFTTLHSGSLALRAMVPLRPAVAVVAIAVPGILLAIVRFDRYLVSWLELLAVLLPPLLVPMVLEASRRRRGREPRPVVAATWVPGALVGLTAAAWGEPVDAVAPVLGLAVAALATALVHRRTR
jgi:cytosine permease